MSEESLKTLKVVISGDISKLKSSTSEATKETRRMIDSINREITKAKGPELNLNQSMSQIRNMQGFIKKSFQDMNNGNLIKGIVSGVKNYVKEAQIAAGIKVPTDAWVENENSIAKCEKTLSSLLDKEQKLKDTGADQKSKSWQSLQYDIRNAEKELEKLYEKEQEMESSGKASDKNPMWKKLQSEITSTENALERYRNRAEKMQSVGTDQESASWRNVQREISVTKAKLEDYQHRKTSMEATGSDVKLNTDGGMTSRMKQIAATTREIVSNIPVIGKVARATGSIAGKAFSGMLATLKQIGPAIKKAAGAFASLIQKFVSGVPAIRKFTSGVNANTGSFKFGLSTLLKYGLGIRSLFVLFNKLRSAVVSGFENLVKYDDATNSSLSMLMSSLTQLKNALATAFAPILNVVAPALNTLIQYVTSAVSALGMLFASLTGQKAYVTAKKVTQDYAASLDKSTSSANAADKATNKLKATILGFDEINKLDDHTSTSSGGTASGLSPSDMFEEIPITNKISSITEKLKEAWRNADFTEIGKIVAEKMNSSLESIPWGKIQTTLNKIAKSTATFLNGFIENADWKLVGKTISTGINTAFETANTFAKNFHWKSFGEAVGNGLNGALGSLDWNKIKTTIHNVVSGMIISMNSFIRTADWTMIGNSIAQFFNAKLEVLYSAVSNFTWADFGASIGNSLNGAVEGIDGEKIADTLSGLLNGLADTLQNFSDTVEWEKMSAKLYLGINGFLHRTHWKALGTALGDLMTNLLNTIFTTVQGTDWYAVGKSIGDFLAGINWKDVLNRVADAIKETAKALPQIALGIVDAIKEGISGMTKDDWLDVADSLFTILIAAVAVKAVAKGPLIAAAMIGKTIKDAFASPAKALGTTVAETAYSGFSSKWTSLLKVGVGAGIFAAVLSATGITTSNYDTAYPEDIQGVVGRVAGNRAQSGDIEKLNEKILELKSNLSLLSDAGKESSDEFQGMTNWVDNLQQVIDTATGKVQQFNHDTGNSRSLMSDATRSYAVVSESAKNYGNAVANIPSTVKTTISANSEMGTRVVSAFKTLADNVGLTKHVTEFKANTTDADGKVNALKVLTAGASGLKNLLIRANTSDAETKTETVSQKVNSIKENSNMTMSMDTSGAGSNLDLFTALKLLVLKALLGSMKLSIDSKDATNAVDTFLTKINSVPKTTTAFIKGDIVDFARKYDTVTNNLRTMDATKIIFFKPDTSAFNGISNSMYNFGNSAANSFVRGMTSVYIPMPHVTFASNAYSNGSGYSMSASGSLRWYRNGGMPDGEIWGMNENGNPEMVGRVGNKTAVANNKVIAEAIKGAVVDGMMEVMMSTQERDTQDESSPTFYIEVKTEDNEVLAKAVTKGQKKIDKKNNP